MVSGFKFNVALCVALCALGAGCGAPARAVKASTPNGGPTGRIASTNAHSPPGSSAAAGHAHYAAGVIHDLNGEAEPALEEFFQAATADPTNEPLIMEVVRRCLVRKQPERALELLVRATAQPSASGILFAQLGRVYSLLGKTESAIKANQTTIKKLPRSLIGYQNLFLDYLRNNQPSEAAKVLDRAAKQPGTDAEFLLGLAGLYAGLGRQVPAEKASSTAQALSALNRAANLNSNAAADPNRLDPFYYFELGAAYERNGAYEPAERAFQKSLELAPDFAEALNYLGYMWAERGVNLEKARELIEKAVKLEPRNAAYLDSLGWVFFKLKQPKPALEYQLRAVELAREPDATLFDHLGDIYAALDQPDKAREAWKKSLAIEPNEAVQKKLQPAAGP